MSTRQRKRLKYIPDQAYRRVLDRARVANPIHWALFFITGHLGLRVGEAMMITADDFDWRQATADVPTLKQRSHEIERFEVRFASEDGEVPRLMREAVDIAAGERRTDWPLFPRTTRWAQKAWHRYVDPMGWKELGIHALRHWFGVATYRDTLNIVYTQQQLRHASINSTMVYVAVVNAEQESKKFKGVSL